MNTGVVGDGAPESGGSGSTAHRDAGGVEPGIRTFLIADIRGYTTFTTEHGDEAAGRLTSHFAAVTERVVLAHDGVVLELRGDEALAVFASARQAIRSAVALQRIFAQPSPDDEFPLPVGIGLDAGEAVPVRGGFRGASLNMAARLCSLAAAGEILATPEVVHLASLVDGTRFVPYGRVQLKGLPHPLDVIAIQPEDSAGGAPKAVAARSRTGSRATVSRSSAWNRPTRHRIRMLAVAVSGAVAVLAVATIVAQSLLPGPAESSRQPATGSVATSSAEATPLSATLVLVPDFRPTFLPAQYMVPDGAAPPSDLPRHLRRPPAYFFIGSPQYDQWHENHAGVPEGRQTVRLVLTGHSDEPVIITQIRPFVIERKPPLTGWWFLPEQGGGVSVRFVEANLDCPRHPAVLVVPDPKTGQITRRTTSIDLKVSRSDVEELEVTAFVNRSFVRWGIQVTYIFDGEVQTLRVSDPRLRVTGQAPGTLRTYTYFPSRPNAGSSAPQGLVRTPRYDSSRETLRSLARYNARLCR